jgi:hypothetical protein
MEAADAAAAAELENAQAVPAEWRRG